MKMGEPKKIKAKIELSIGTVIFGAILMRSCVAGSINGRLDKINETLQSGRMIEYQLKKENVLDSALPEEFYEINGKRVYLKIDDRPIEELYRTNAVEKDR
jgi:hypothetical protein